MKPKKVIDATRMQQSLPVPPKPCQPLTLPEAAKPDENGRPPVYTESTAVALNRNRLFESRCVCLWTDAPELDFYKVLRTRILQRTKEKGWNTIMITSANPGEGKTLTAINLAFTFAKAYGQTVLLVDCDLRQQKIHTYLGLDSHNGIADYLLYGRPLKELILWPKVAKMTLISGGQTIIESAELLGSERMRKLVAEIKYRYGDRYIIFDTPPLLTGADALTFAPLVDGIIMVVQEGKTPLKEVEKALDLIPKEKFLGFALNKARIARKGYYSDRL